MTLDLAHNISNTKRETQNKHAASGAAQKKKPTLHSVRLSSSPEPEYEDGVPDNSGSMQILDIHTRNPLISYRAQLFSCEWLQTVGTDVIFSEAPHTVPGSVNIFAQSNDDRTKKLPFEPKVKGNGWALLTTTSNKLVARAVKAIPKDGKAHPAKSEERSQDAYRVKAPLSTVDPILIQDTVSQSQSQARNSAVPEDFDIDRQSDQMRPLNNSEPDRSTEATPPIAERPVTIPIGISATREKQSQATFLERLIKAKQSRGETDKVWLGRARHYEDGWNLEDTTQQDEEPALAEDESEPDIRLENDYPIPRRRDQSQGPEPVNEDPSLMSHGPQIPREGSGSQPSGHDMLLREPPSTKPASDASFSTNSSSASAAPFAPLSSPELFRQAEAASSANPYYTTNSVHQTPVRRGRESRPRVRHLNCRGRGKGRQAQRPPDWNIKGSPNMAPIAQGQGSGGIGSSHRTSRSPHTVTGRRRRGGPSRLQEILPDVQYQEGGHNNGAGGASNVADKGKGGNDLGTHGRGNDEENVESGPRKRRALVRRSSWDLHRSARRDGVVAGGLFRDYVPVEGDTGGADLRGGIGKQRGTGREAEGKEPNDKGDRNEPTGGQVADNPNGNASAQIEVDEHIDEQF